MELLAYQIHHIKLDTAMDSTKVRIVAAIGSLVEYNYFVGSISASSDHFGFNFVTLIG